MVTNMRISKLERTLERIEKLLKETSEPGAAYTNVTDDLGVGLSYYPGAVRR